jgi:hypothetical protein
MISFAASFIEQWDGSTWQLSEVQIQDLDVEDIPFCLPVHNAFWNSNTPKIRFMQKLRAE